MNFASFRQCLKSGKDSSWAQIFKPFRKPRNRFPAWRAGARILFDVPARARLQRLAESISWNRFLSFLNVYKYGLWLVNGILVSYSRDEIMYCTHLRAFPFGSSLSSWRLMSPYYSKQLRDWIISFSKGAFWARMFWSYTFHDMYHLYDGPKYSHRNEGGQHIITA